MFLVFLFLAIFSWASVRAVLITTRPIRREIRSLTRVVRLHTRLSEIILPPAFGV
jgi:hypothetical protein